MAFLGAESFGRSTTVSQYSEYTDGFSGGISSIRTDGPWPSGVTNYARFNGFLQGINIPAAAASGSTAIIQGRMRVAVMPGEAVILRINEGGASACHVTITLNGDGSLRAYRGDWAILLGASGPGVILVNTWQYLKFKTTINDATGTVQLYVNGTLVLNLSGQDTRNGGAGTWDSWSLVRANNSVGPIDWTDLYWADGSGSAPNNDLIQECRVEWIQASAGNGNTSQSTPSTGTDRGAMVDDTPSADDDSTYNTLSVVGNKDTVPCTDLIATGTVYGVHYKARAKKTDSSAIGLTPVVRIGGVDYDLTGAAVGTPYTTVHNARQVSPATTSAWTVSEINAMEIGYKMLSI